MLKVFSFRFAPGGEFGVAPALVLGLPTRPPSRSVGLVLFVRRLRCLGVDEIPLRLNGGNDDVASEHLALEAIREAIGDVVVRVCAPHDLPVATFLFWRSPRARI